MTESEQHILICLLITDIILKVQKSPV